MAYKNKELFIEKSYKAYLRQLEKLQAKNIKLKPAMERDFYKEMFRATKEAYPEDKNISKTLAIATTYGEVVDDIWSLLTDETEQELTAEGLAFLQSQNIQIVYYKNGNINVNATKSQLRALSGNELHEFIAAMVDFGIDIHAENGDEAIY